VLSSPAMARKTKARARTVALIGSGNLAQALGPALRSAGYRITTVAGRNNAASMKRASALARKLGTTAIRFEEAEPEADIIWLCHTDDALADTARKLARKPGLKNKIVLHSSGALSSDVLAPVRRAGAHTASLHPMMTFVSGTTPKMQDVPFAVEGDREAVKVAKEIASQLGAKVFTIKKSNKVLYHALGSFSSPMIVAALVTAERVGRGAGLNREQTRTIIGPILEQTLTNYRKHGPAAAFSGPIKRGDLETVRRHLQQLARVPQAREVYRALVRSALLDLPAKNRGRLLKLLK
jgi:predicted short-subunit dehydrogenase-like oxidoreductase (DUF2520 family)